MFAKDTSKSELIERNCHKKESASHPPGLKKVQISGTSAFYGAKHSPSPLPLGRPSADFGPSRASA